MNRFNHLNPMLATHLRAAADFIEKQQLPDGCIPWFDNGKCDPWDLVEAAMGLTVAGKYLQARRAYIWLSCQQLDDGSWWANYLNNQPLDTNHRETHFVAYIATGVWHYFLTTGDSAFLQNCFPMIEKAIDFVVKHQSASGEIYWAVDAGGEPKKDALVTACASIYKSLACALAITRQLQIHKSGWQTAYEKLGDALRHKPECFDRTWESKERFSMDWFYPILSGVFSRQQARQRLQDRWHTFVEKDVGCRCVSDEPWMTIAESCELTLALVAAGQYDKAEAVFSRLHRWQDHDGGYWTGYNFRDDVIWPDEKTTWTAGVVLLAADALYKITPASGLFSLETPLLLPA